MLSDDELVEALLEVVHLGKLATGPDDIPHLPWVPFREIEKDEILEMAAIFERAAKRIREVCGTEQEHKPCE